MKLKKLLAGAMALALALSLAAPALAAEEDAAPILSAEDTAPAPQEFDAWAYEYVADSYALGLVDDNYGSYIKDPITQEQLDAILAVVANKLALLELPQRTAEDQPLTLDLTRGGVVNALYQLCADYEIPGVEAGAIPFLHGLQVVQGTDNGDLATEYPCTYQEAMVMAQRLILTVYDMNDAGSRGLFWKATNGGNTLYLLGTIHVDRSNIYPFHKTLRSAIAASDEVIFELDLNDLEGQAEFAAMQMYSDGTTLADHISPELYAMTVELFAALGLTEEAVAVFKPWALAATLSSLLTQDDSTSATAMAIDLYVNAAAVNAGKAIGAVETYAFQGAIFDDLSPEYQEEYLATYVVMVLSALSGQAPSEEDAQAAQEALELQNQMLDAMMEAWKSGDVAAFEAAYSKEETINSTDELNAKLFTDRDPHMIEAAASYLETEGENTFFLAVGAGHMVDPGGIVSGLRELGYTVEQVK